MTSDRDAPLDAPQLSILHLDMDSFYVAVEIVKDPSLAGKPVVVGGTGARGVVASASYEARAFGVRSAMPSARARRLCPEAIFIQGDHAAYGEASEQIHRILGSVTPVIEPIALDEAFLDVSAARQLFGSGRDIAWLLRERIQSELDLSCSVGVAAKKLFAKLASEDAKPTADRTGTRPGSGVRVIAPEEEISFLHSLPVRALWGVGPQTFERLKRLGVATIGDLAGLRKDLLLATFGQSHGTHLHELSHGIDPRPVQSERGVKSISHEQTFSNDLTDRREIDEAVVRLADAVAGRLRAAAVKAGTVQLKLRFADFSTITRSAKQPVGVDSGPGLARVVKQMLDQIDCGVGVRLLGVAGGSLHEHGEMAVQLQLDAVQSAADGATTTDADNDNEEEWSSVSETIDEIRAKFGRHSIGPSPAVTTRAPGRDLWGPERSETAKRESEHSRGDGG